MNEDFQKYIDNFIKRVQILSKEIEQKGKGSIVRHLAQELDKSPI
jgi:hypothetical protein